MKNQTRWITMTEAAERLELSRQYVHRIVIAYRVRKRIVSARCHLIDFRQLRKVLDR